VYGIIAINFALTLLTGLGTLRDFPNSGDEYAYLLSATLFAEARLWVPSPEPRQFFDVFHVINDGHYYGKYPPGWPLILSLGVLAHAPWLVNPLLGMLTMLLLHRLALKTFSREVANAALCAAAVNPFLIFNSASYFSHPSCLLFVTLFAYAFFRWLREPVGRLPYVLMGASLGAAFLIRPYTALALALPFGAWLLVIAVRSHRLHMLWRGLPLSTGAFLVLFTAFLVYNYLQTGEPLVQPVLKYDPTDRPSLLTRGWRDTLYVNRRPLVELTLWIPLSVPLLLAFALARKRWRDIPTLVLSTAALSLFVAYVFYERDAVNRYGPRYLYEASFAIFILMGCVVAGWKRLGVSTLLVIVGLNMAVFTTLTVRYAAQVRGRMMVYDLVTQKHISNAIVFLSTGSGTMHQYDLSRSGIHFDQSVLYVRDLGERNPELLRMHPGREAYVYEYDRQTGTARLIPYPRQDAVSSDPQVR
jgi:4-amino-4-deoxy-L-arabinose transferase-like glycosyltransferase